MFGKKSDDDARVAASFAGLAAGAAMALGFMVRSATIGEGFWHPLKYIAGFWSGPEALVAGSNAILIGALTHLGASVGLGNPLGWTIEGKHSIAAGLFSGLLYGIIVWGLMTFAVVPSFNETMTSWVDAQPVWFWFGLHLLYGGVLGALIPPIDRAIRGRR